MPAGCNVQRAATEQRSPRSPLHGLSRRDFVRTSTAAVLGLGWAGCRVPRPLDRIGVQLYTVRRAMEQDFSGTLARVAEIGYREVEFAGYFGRNPAGVRAALDAAGLAAPAAHVPFEALREGWDEVLDAANRIGHRYVVVAWIPEQERRTLDAYRAMGELFNRAGEAARTAGLTYAYHNHDFEFAPLEGQVPYDVLLAETDPALVGLELDLFWITKGGRDPLAYFDRHPGRFPMLHVKDMNAAGEMVDVGQGTIDFRGIFARSDQAGVRHYFVEHDEPSDPFASIRASHDYLRSLGR